MWDLITEGVGVAEGEIPGNDWWTGVEWPLGGEGVTWAGPADRGGPLMTEEEVGEGEAATVFCEGTRPGNTGVMGVVGGAWDDGGLGGCGVDGVGGLEPWEEGVGVPGLLFC